MSKDNKSTAKYVWGLLLGCIVIFCYIPFHTSEQDADAVSVFMSCEIVYFLACFLYELYCE